MKSQIIKIKNIPSQSEKNQSIRVKPVIALLLVLAYGIYSCFRMPYLISANLYMVMIPVFALLVLPDRKLIDFYDTYCILYNQMDRTTCMLVYYDEIVSWQYEWHANVDYFVLNLVDGSSEQIEMYSKYKVAKRMETYAPGKEIKSSRIKEPKVL